MIPRDFFRSAASPFRAKRTFSEAEAWLWLLDRQRWGNDAEILPVGSKQIAVGRGQILTSTRELADAWRWSESAVRRYLRRLEKAAQIRRTSGAELDRRATHLTVVNHEIYIGERRTDDAKREHKLNANRPHKETVNTEEMKNTDDAPPPKLADASPTAALIFPVRGRSAGWTLDPAIADGWTDTYPDLDVSAELRKARAWIEANPRKRKSPAGMPKFLIAWLNRATHDRVARPIARKNGATSDDVYAYSFEGVPR